MKLVDLPSFDRPREKLRSKGVSYLSDTELLALIIRHGSRRRNVLEISSNLLKRYPVASLNALTYADFLILEGIDEALACSIVAAIELGKRLNRHVGDNPPVLTQPQDLLLLVSDIAVSKKEHFVVLYLNARNHLICRELISVGTVNASIVHPREVFEPAVRHVATQLILVHNHPSGDPEPSDADIVLTKRLQEVGKLMGIEIADHVIVAGTRYVSLREKGAIV